jgi:hypothetical protein
MRGRERGTTLLELLIAVTLVSMLTVGILYAMRVGVDAMQRTDQRFLLNRRVLGVERALHDQISGLMPAWAECAGQGGVPGGQKTALFHGEPMSMRFVTSYSLQEGARGYPKLLEYLVIPGENGVGVRLVVNELPYAGPPSVQGVCGGVLPDPETGEPTVQYLPVAAGPGSFILADKMAAIRFFYREELLPPVFERWRPRWGLGKFPAAVRIEMAPLEVNTSGLQATSVTVPVRINGNPLFQYAD